MAITIAFDPASPVHVVSATRISVAGLPDDIKNYKLTATASGQDTMTSVVFAGGSGLFVWDNLIFPASGSWTLSLIDTSDDSVDKTQAVTVT